MVDQGKVAIVWFGKPTKKDTLPETNVFASKNGWLEYSFPVGEAYFQVGILFPIGDSRNVTSLSPSTLRWSRANNL